MPIEAAVITEGKPNVFSSPFSDVALDQMEVGGEKVDKMAVRVMDDAGIFRTQAVVGMDYALIPNTLARQVGEDVMARSPYTWEHMATAHTGKVMSLSYRSDLILEVPEVGDTIALGIRIENSYDKSIKFKASLMAYVLSCLNGMTSRKFFKSFTFRHHESSGDFDVADISEKLLEGEGVLRKIAPVLAELKRAPLRSETICQAARELSVPGNNFMNVVKSLPAKSSNWDFMQALTAETTHQMKGVSALRHSESVGDFFLGSLTPAEVLTDLL